MAAFSFPQNPNNGDTTTNSATGLTYVFVALPSPGKWEVQMRDSDGDFVNVSGDTMTGALDIVPANPIPASTGDASLFVQSSPFSALAENQNYISRVLEAKTNQGHNIFSVRDNDATNLPILQGRISAVSSYAADTLVQPSLNSITADDFPVAGLRAGFRIGGRVQGGANGDVLTCTYFQSEGTQLDYYGDMLTETSLVTKKYVDDTSVESSLIHGGTVAEGEEGSISGSGNLAVQRSSTAKGGNFYVRTSSGGNLIALEQAGKLTLTPSSTIADGIINLTTVYDSSGADNFAVKFNYKDSGNNINNFLSINATNHELKYVGNTTITGSVNVQDSIHSTEANTTLASNGDITTNGVVTITGSQSEFLKGRGHDGDRDFVIYGSTQTNPTQEDDVLFGTYRNTLSNAVQPDAIAYFGKVDGDDNIQTKKSVTALINSISPATSDSPTFNNLTVTGKIGGDSSYGGASLDVSANAVDINVGGRLTLPNYINASSATTPTIQLLNGNDALIFRSDTKLGLTDTTGRIGYISQAGMAMYQPFYIFGENINGSDNPDASGMYGQISFNSASSYGIFQSKGASQNGYQFYLDSSTGTNVGPKKGMSWLLSADGTKGYFNCYYGPQNDYGLVRRMDLKSGTVTAINTYSVSGVEGTDSYTFHVSNHNIPGQCTFEGLPNGGSGFQLIGKTQGDPSNSSARLLATSHYSADQAAQLEYFGDTTGTDNCLQTKASVTALINGSSNSEHQSSTLYGATKILAADDGTAPSFKIRNSGDTSNIFNVSTNGVVTLTNDLNGAHDIKFTGNNLETSSTQLIISALGNNSSIQHYVYDASGSPQRVTYVTKDACNIYKPVLISGSLNVSNSNGITTSGSLQSTHTDPSGGIILDSLQTTSAIKAIGSSTKNFKIYIGYNANNTQQVFMCSKTQMYFGNGNNAMDYKFTSSDSTIPLKFNDGVSFVLNNGDNPITFTQNKIANVNTIEPTDTDLALMFNNTENGPTFSQGTVKNINIIKASTDSSSMHLQVLGGTSQQLILQTTTPSGDTYNTAVFDDAHAKLPGELDIYQNYGGQNGKIYSYGYSRGLDIYAADYNTSKAQANLVATFDAGSFTLKQNYFSWDNTSAHALPQNNLTFKVGTGAQGDDAAYPKINFAWATSTGVTYEHNFTMEYTQFTNVPDVVLLNGSRVTQAAAPSNGNHLCNKTYVDNKVSSVSVSGTTQDVGTFTLTLDGTGTTPTSKQTVSAHYRKIGHIVHIVAHNASIDLTGYAGSSIRMTGLPFQPDDDIPVQIGHIHAVNFMVNNYHADDDQVAVVMYDSTYGSHFRIFAGQVTNESTYIPNQTGASMTISATYIAES